MHRKKVIIIGASSGIGKELARVFGDHGYAVGVTARRFELLTEVAGELPGKSFVRHMDIAKCEEAMVVFEDLIKEMGGIDIVVINAGIGFLNPDLEWEKEKLTVDVNVEGFMAIANTAMKHFLKQCHGHLVGISSIAALRGDSVAPAYSASKAFMSNYMEALRSRMRKKKLPITVTDIQPGIVDTRMAQGEGLFWIASPRKAAVQIYNAIRKKKKHAYITRRWGIIARLMKIAPGWMLERFY